MNDPNVAVPERPYMPPDLPPTSRVDGGVFVPDLHWDALTEFRDLWRQYPGQCEGSINDCHRLWRVILRVETAIEAKRLVKRQIEARGGTWPRWQAYLGIVAGIVGGVAVGVGFGAAMVLLD